MFSLYKFILFFGSFATGFAISCHECAVDTTLENGSKAKNCAKVATSALTKCGKEATHCITMYGVFNGKVIIERGCGLPLILPMQTASTNNDSVDLKTTNEALKDNECRVVQYALLCQCKYRNGCNDYTFPVPGIHYDAPEEVLDRDRQARLGQPNAEQSPTVAANLQNFSYCTTPLVSLIIFLSVFIM